MKRKLFLKTTLLAMSVVIAAVLSVSYAPRIVSAEGNRLISDSTMPSDTIRSLSDLLGTAGARFDTTGLLASYEMFVVMEPRWDSTPGPVDLVLTVVNLADDGYTDFEIRAYEYDGLQLLSPLPQTFELLPGDMEIVDVKIDVPANDTSRICLTIGCGPRTLFRNASFLADSVFAEYSPLWVHNRLQRPGLGEVQLPHDSRYRQRMMDSLRKIGPQTQLYIRGKDGQDYNIDSLPADFEPWEPKATNRHDVREAGVDSVSSWGMNDRGEWVPVSRDSVNESWQRERIESPLRRRPPDGDRPMSVGFRSGRSQGSAPTPAHKKRPPLSDGPCSVRGL